MFKTFRTTTQCIVVIMLAKRADKYIDEAKQGSIIVGLRVDVRQCGNIVSFSGVCFVL